MDKIFDVLFFPKRFFKTYRLLKPWDSLTAIITVWLTNSIILYPLLKEAPFFGNFFGLSLMMLILFLLYWLWSVAVHVVVGKAKITAMWSFPYVFIPHVMSGWFFSLTLSNKFMNFLFLIPIVWSTILEFYFVRSLIGYGALYTVIVRISRDVIFIFGLYAFLRGWII